MNSESSAQQFSPQIAVVVVNYNSGKLLQKLLRSLAGQVTDRHEVLVVDNASQDESAEQVQADFPEVQLIRSEENLGFAGGNNLGASKTNADWLLLLNPDTEAEPGLFDRLEEALEKHPSCSFFALMMLSLNDPEIVDSGGDGLYFWGPSLNHAAREVDDPLFTLDRPVLSACGGALMIRSSLFEKLGGFDGDFFLLFEDLDLSLRARHLGEEIFFLPEARVFHAGGSVIGRQSGLSLRYCTRNIWFVRLKNFPLLLLLRSLPFLLFSTLLDGVYAVKGRRFFSWLQGLAGVFVALPALLKKRQQILKNSKWSPAPWLESGWFFLWWNNLGKKEGQ